MQPHDSNSERPKASDTDGGWDAKQRAVLDAIKLVLQKVLNTSNRTVCLSANLRGSGGLTHRGL